MWYRLGYFVPGASERRKGTNVPGRWGIISGPHYRRFGVDSRRDRADDMAVYLARMSGYELESIITVHERDLNKYQTMSLPWLLAQSTLLGEK